jgi:hypothetical protein
MKFFLKDFSQNTGREYIADDRQNCTLQENAASFDSQRDAEEFAFNLFGPNWVSWGYIAEEEVPE